MNIKHPFTKEIEAIKNTSYEEGKEVFFIFPEKPDKEDWERAKGSYQLRGQKIFYKVLNPRWQQ